MNLGKWEDQEWADDCSICEVCRQLFEGPHVINRCAECGEITHLGRCSTVHIAGLCRRRMN